MAEVYKFQRLEVYRLALQYLDAIYELAGALPASERLNLADQMRRAATSIVLNIAEGSTGQTDAEQRRLLGLCAHTWRRSPASTSPSAVVSSRASERPLPGSRATPSLSSSRPSGILRRPRPLSPVPRPQSPVSGGAHE